MCIFFCYSHVYNKKQWICMRCVLRVVWLLQLHLPTPSRVISLALGQSYDCPSASEASLKNIGTKITTIPATGSDDITTAKQNRGHVLWDLRTEIRFQRSIALCFSIFFYWQPFCPPGFYHILHCVYDDDFMTICISEVDHSLRPSDTYMRQ